MTRELAVAVLVCAVASGAQAKDVCVAIDAPDLTVLMKGVKIGRGRFGPVHGYLNNPDPVTTNDRINPVDGQAIVSSAGILIAGLAWHEVAVGPNGGNNVLDEIIPVNLSCLPGDDGKIGVDDLCNAFVAGNPATAHVISCKDVAPIP